MPAWTSVNWDAWQPEIETVNPAGEGWNDRLPAIRQSEASDAFDRVFGLGAFPVSSCPRRIFRPGSIGG